MVRENARERQGAVQGPTLWAPRRRLSQASELLRNLTAIAVTLGALVLLQATMARRFVHRLQRAGGARLPLDAPRLEATPAFRALQAAEPEVFRCIEELVHVSGPGPGYHPGRSGTGFVLVPAVGGLTSLSFGAAPAEVPAPFRRLVELGPRAIPGLLALLSDPRPTGVLLTHDQAIGTMWHEREVHYDAELPERVALADELRISNRHRSPLHGDSLTRYRLKVGDLCFAALGQIVGRSYEAARHQPTACIVLNSPVANPEIATFVRTIWGGATRQELDESLLRDLGSTDPDLRAGAAARLWVYYPERAREPLLRAIREEDGELIELLVQLGDAEFDRELDRLARVTTRPLLFARSTRPDVVVENTERWMVRATELLEAADSTSAEDRYGALLIGKLLLDHVGEGARAWFDWAVTQPEVAWKLAACHAARVAGGGNDWLVDVLAPFLDDRTAYPAEHLGASDGLRGTAARTIVVLLGSEGMRPIPNRRNRERWIAKVKELVESR